MDTEERGAWPARPVLLLALGALSGLAFQQLTKGSQPFIWTDDPLRLGAATAVAAAGIAFAFSVERSRWTWSAVFALAAGLVVGGVAWRNGAWSGWGANEGWQLFSALLCITIAVPLFQTIRDAGRAKIDYQTLHAHSWTCTIDFTVLEETGHGWREAEGLPTGSSASTRKEEEKRIQALRAAALAGKVELRTVQARQLFVDGKPQGPALR